MHTHTRTRMQARTHACMHIYMHMRTHTCTHTVCFYVLGEDQKSWAEDCEAAAFHEGQPSSSPQTMSASPSPLQPSSSQHIPSSSPFPRSQSCPDPQTPYGSSITCQSQQELEEIESSSSSSFTEKSDLLESSREKRTVSLGNMIMSQVSTSKETERKALYRAKKYLKKLNASVLQKLLDSINKTPQSTPKIRKPTTLSPSPKSVKSALYRKIGELQKKRSKKCLYARKLFLDVLTPEKETDLLEQETSSVYKRKKKPATKAAVEYLDDIAVHMPGKRTVLKRTLQQKKILPKKMKRLHRDFREKHPDNTTSLRTFYRHLPSNIVSSSKLAYKQCLCETCTNIDLKLDVVNTITKLPIDGRDVASESTLCQTPTLACLDRKCNQCGVDKFSNLLHENLRQPLSETVSWKSWDMVKTGVGKRRELVQKKGTVEELLQELMKELSRCFQNICLYSDGSSCS